MAPKKIMNFIEQGIKDQVTKIYNEQLGIDPTNAEENSPIDFILKETGLELKPDQTKINEIMKYVYIGMLEAARENKMLVV
jgi:hypothetical protein